ncbi:MAG TPA: CDP-diacylglycerol--serine O-phosphatidyltransferase [Beijerinckiaceae bacterium]|nr:CDP-diacylglycerol--serine O-phosphatidyltransferase [Beijerinckiaceae bacterium]
MGRFKRVPMRIILPNLVTLLALSLGLTSIRFAAEARFPLAVAAVIAAAVLDGLDGRIARALEGATRFGAELDSLADFVDFGVAPAFLLYFWSLHDIKSFGWFAAMVFAIACALRLARFNVMIEDPERPAWSSHFFIGMPAPAGAIVVLLPLYLNLSVFGMPNDPRFAPFEIVYALIIAFLMVSRIPHFSGKKIGRVPREWVIAVLFGVAVTVLLVATFPMEMLVVLTLAYLCLVPFSIRRYRAYVEAEQRAAASIVMSAAPVEPGDQ